MSKLIIVGHGGYGKATLSALTMLLGPLDGLFALDFEAGENITQFAFRLREVVATCAGDGILFACDLAGGSPYRLCTALCDENPGHRLVGGLNLAAYAELSYNLELSPAQLSQLAVETTRESIVQYPRPSSLAE